MQQAEKDTIIDDVPSFEIEAKREPIDIDRDTDDAELMEDDPRTAIYKKYAENRQNRQDGVEVAVDTATESDQDAPTDGMVKVKVNGEEREIPRSKIEAAGGIAAFQKNAAASELLNQASIKERQLRQQEAQLDARRHELQQMEQDLQSRARPVPLPEQGAEDIKELARKYHVALLEDGDIDAANDILARLQAARNATPDMEELTRQATIRVRQEMAREQNADLIKRFEQERGEAAGTFADKYPDLADDPELFEMTDRKTIEIQARNPSWSPSQIIDAAAGTVRDWFNGKTTPSANSDKLDAKRQQTTVRGGSARSIPRPAPKPLSRSQYVEELRIKRGLE